MKNLTPLPNGKTPRNAEDQTAAHDGQNAAGTMRSKRPEQQHNAAVLVFFLLRFIHAANGSGPPDEGDDPAAAEDQHRHAANGSGQPDEDDSGPAAIRRKTSHDGPGTPRRRRGQILHLPGYNFSRRA